MGKCCEPGDRKIKKRQAYFGVSGVKWRFHIEVWLGSGWKKVRASVWRALDVTCGSLRLYHTGFHDKCNAKEVTKIPHSGRVNKGSSRHYISFLLEFTILEPIA